MPGFRTRARTHALTHARTHARPACIPRTLWPLHTSTVETWLCNTKLPALATETAMAMAMAGVGPAAAAAGIDPAKKQAPRPGVGGLHYVYAPAPDGADSNLLILLHGLGDNEAPFAQLGRQLARGPPGGGGGPLPQTATLAVRGPERLPFFYDEPRFLWWKAFSPLGEGVCPSACASPPPACSLRRCVAGSADWLIG